MAESVTFEPSVQLIELRGVNVCVGYRELVQTENLEYDSLGAQSEVASLVANFLSACLVGPLATIAFSLVYFDERVRKEAFDLQLMMSTLDAPTLQPSPA
jgi:hypothetical protein